VDKYVDKYVSDYLFLIYSRIPSHSIVTYEYVIKCLQSFETLVKKWSCRSNIVSPGDVDNLWIKHFIPSLKPLELLPENAICLDAGSGAGFPAIPLKIFRPDLKLTLCESNRKKALFLQKAVSVLGLKEVIVENSRVENLSTFYDIVLSRAMGKPPQIVPLLTPRLNPGGKMILWTFKAAVETFPGFDTTSFDILDGGKLMLLQSIKR